MGLDLRLAVGEVEGSINPVADPEIGTIGAAAVPLEADMGKNANSTGDLETAMADALASVERIEAEGSNESVEEPIVECVEGEDDESAVAKTTDDEEVVDGVSALKDQLLRLAADFENFRKRSGKEVTEARKFGSERALLGIIPVLDNLQRALDHALDDETPIAQGVRMVVKQFVDVLGSFGVVGFDSLGEAFDPERHEAMGQTPSPDHEPGTVLQEMLRGYFLHDRLIRPAQVIVVAAEVDESEASETAANEDEAGSAEV